MAVFLKEDVKRLLYYKYVVIIGDSVQRGMYKDLVALLQTNNLLSGYDLKVKGEISFMNDRLLDGGSKAVMSNGIDYKEVREYKTHSHLLRFYFVTRVRNKYWTDVIFRDLSQEPRPDVVVMNSCLWDISRYPFGMQQYPENLRITFQMLKNIVPDTCLCIWNTTLPVANTMKGGFLLPEMLPFCDAIRTDIVAANYYAKQQASIFNIHVLDLNYVFQFMMGMQEKDGIHWNEVAHRCFTNFLLKHICTIWSTIYHHNSDSLAKRTLGVSSCDNSSSPSRNSSIPHPKVVDFPQTIPQAKCCLVSKFCKHNKKSHQGDT